MREKISVIFAYSESIQEHCLKKTIEWARGCPDDRIYWIRPKPLERLPDETWSNHLWELKRIIFKYNQNKTPIAAINALLTPTITTNAAAIIVTISRNQMEKRSVVGLLAAMANYCRRCESRAILCIEMWKEEEEVDEWMEGPTKPDDDSGLLNEETDKKQIVDLAGIYTTEIFDYDGDFRNIFY